MEQTEFWCSECGENHVARCPKTTAERREQNRSAQARYRAARKDRDALEGRLRAQIAALKEKVARLETEAKDRPCPHAHLLGTSDGRKLRAAFRRVAEVVHPDKHDGAVEANRLMRLAIEARDVLTKGKRT